LTAYPSDDRIGIVGLLSPQANRLACLAAATWSFDIASDRLDELAGVRTDDETIRRHRHRGLGDAPRRGPAQIVLLDRLGGDRVPDRRSDDPDPRRLA
jgi:hypothetical protein